MRKNNLLTAVVTLALCLLPMLAGALSYHRLPDSIPVHFTIHNQPDLYASKPFALFGIPLIMFAAQCILLFAFSHVTKLMTAKPKLFTVVVWIVPVLTVLVNTLILVFALGHSINIGRYVLIFIGLLFCLLGNYFPKTSYEQTKEYMHPRPRDEKSFRRVTKTVGYSLAALGLAFLVFAWLV